MKVILVDDHVSFRESLRMALTQEHSMDVTGETGSAREVPSLIAVSRPDLVVSDLMLGDTDGVSLAVELRRHRPRVPVMLLTAYRNPTFVRLALDAGVAGYAHKGQPLADVVQAMRTVGAGGKYVFPGHAEQPAGDGVDLSDDSRFSQLSRREREIFMLLLQGRSTGGIARALFISVKTVETHRSHINRKLGVHSPGDLMRQAVRMGLVGQGAASAGDDHRDALT
jgi:DNA-binding NarL/FixJ family response regulator